PKATWAERRAVLGSSLNGSGEIGRVGDGKRVLAIVDTTAMIVADPVVLRDVGLSRADASTLRRVGVLVLPRPDGATTSDSGSVDVSVGCGSSARRIPAARAAHPMRTTAGISILITEERARELGLAIVPAGQIVTNPTAFNESQRASIDALAASLPGLKLSSTD